MMTAVRLVGKQALSIEQIPVPTIGDDELLVRVRSALICGTDVRMYKGGNPARESRDGLTLGHEVAGVIASVGGAITRYREGESVAVNPNMGCGVCDFCVEGNTQMCPELKALGIHIDGAFAEYVRIPREAVSQGNVVTLDASVSFDEAALAEPLSCVLNAAERCRTQPGEIVLVIGAGPIGIMHARIQQMLGAGAVLIHDLNEQRLARCRRLDSNWEAVGPDGLDQAVDRVTGGKGADVCIVAAPSGDAHQRGLELLGTNGRLMLFGGLPKDQEVVPFNSNLIHYKQLIVTGTTRQNLRQYRAALALISKGKLPVKDLVTQTFGLADAELAFAEAVRGSGLKLGFSIDQDDGSA